MLLSSQHNQQGLVFGQVAMHTLIRKKYSCVSLQNHNFMCDFSNCPTILSTYESGNAHLCVEREIP